MNPPAVRYFLIEDDPALSDLLRGKLATLGYECAGHTDRAEGAVALLAAAAPQIAILDIKLPGPVSGLDIARALRARSDVPVVFLSAFFEDEFLQQAAAVDCYGYLTKPFRDPELHATLQTALRKHGVDRELRAANRRLAAGLETGTAELGRMNAALRHSDSLLASIDANLTGAAVYRLEYRPDGGIVCTHVSPGIAELTGRPAADFLTDVRTFFALVPPEDLATVRDGIVQARHSTERLAFETRLRHAGDGGLRWLQFRSRPVEERPDGTRVRDGVVTDITAAKQAEAVLREDARRMAQMFLAAPAATSLSDLRTGEFIDVNDRFCELVARPRAALVGRTSAEIGLWQNPADRARLEAVVARDGRADREEIAFLLPDGTVRNVGLSVAVAEVGGRRCALSTLADITARKQAEAEVRSQTAFLAALHETTLDLLNRRDLPELLQTLIGRAAVLLDATAVELLLHEGGELVIRGCTKNVQGEIGQRIARDEAPLSWQAFDSGRTVALADYASFPHRPNHYDFHRPKGVLELPVLRGGERLGVISLARSDPGRPFTIEEIRRGEMLARQAALVLHNATLRADALREAEQRTAALRASEEHFRTFVENISQGYYVADRRSLFRYCNAAASAMLGQSEAGLLGTSSFRIVAPEDRARIIAAYRQWDRSEAKDATIEFRIGAREGRVIWVEQTTAIVRDRAGAVTEFRCVVRDITERKAAEAAWRASEERFRLANRAVFNVIWDQDIATGAIWWNEHFEPAFGHSAAEASRDGGFWRAHLHPADRDRVTAQVAEALASDADTWSDSYRFRRKDGAYAHVEDRAHIVRDAAGNPIRLLGAMRDLTARVRMEQALRESEAHYRSLVESVTQGYYVADRRGFFTYCNPALHAMGGFAPGELPGVSSFRLIVEADRPRVMAAYRQWLAAPAAASVSCEFRVRGKNGREFWVEQTTDFRRDADGRVLEGRNILHDIDARKRAEAALRESEEKFRGVFDRSPVAIGLLSVPEGRFVEFNDACLTMFGYSRAEAVGRTSVEMNIWADPAARARYLGLLKANGMVTNFETRMRRKDGTLFDVLYTGNFLPIAGRPYSLNSMQDITARKQAEQRVADSLHEKETLLREIHHRVKNNLQIISSLLHFQAKKAGGGEELAVFADGQNRLRAMILVHEKLYRSDDLHRIHLGDYLGGLAEQLQRSFRETAGRIGLRVESDDLRAPAEIALPCGMIVTELVTNACKYAFPGGTRGEVVVRLARTADGFTLAVADDGAGLPADFDPQRSGSFGLQLVRNLTAQLGARFSRTPGPGTAFLLAVPVAGGMGVTGQTPAIFPAPPPAPPP
jgi:PAS domain S-box-containing protein